MLVGSKKLFGADPEPRIIAVEWEGGRGGDALGQGNLGNGVRIFSRQSDTGLTEARRETWRPFFWSTIPSKNSVPLEGNLALRYLVQCESWEELEKIRRDPAENFILSDPVQQYLTVSGKTLFKEMNWSALRRLQLRVSRVTKSTVSTPLLGIGISDQTGWQKFLEISAESRPEDERAALEALNQIIAERDPDVLEGHNLLRIDLPYLMERARKVGCTLKWGRDGSMPRTRLSRLQIAEKTIQFNRFSVQGRHILDTWILAQFYDVGTRDLEGLDLSTVAAHFGISHKKPAEVICRSPEFLKQETLNETREIRAIADLLGPSYFIQTQIFPMTFQEVMLRGNATRIDSLFLREYLRCQYSIPQLPEPEPFEGGYADIFVTGVLKNVWHCDVTSLYPSVILRFGLTPALDQLQIFSGFLKELRTFRLEAKSLMRRHPAHSAERHYYNALQNVFKILINSFYGYLGFAQGHFADFQAAAAVTARGRDLLRSMVEWLNGQGAHVIEMDTDGIYFQPPPGSSLEKMEAELCAQLPEGIDVEFDHRYEAMFSYKVKNYALLDLEGRVTLKGAALKSRGMERYLRNYLMSLIQLLLKGKTKEATLLRDDFAEKIRNGQWPLEMLMKTDTLQDSPASYQKKISTSSRNRSAAFELALKNGGYQAGDQISYYITGTQKNVTAYQAAKLASHWDPEQRDENIAYYLKKLDDLAKKFSPFLSGYSNQNKLGGTRGG